MERIYEQFVSVLQFNTCEVMDDEELSMHLYSICKEMNYVWPSMKKDIDETVKKDREVSQLHSKSRMFDVSIPSSFSSTSHNLTREIQGQEGHGSESKRSIKFNSFVSKLPSVRTTSSWREEVLGNEKAKPTRNSEILLERI